MTSEQAAKIQFTRTLRGPGLKLSEQLKVERLGEIEMFYYRSKWELKAKTHWSTWGYWSQFPKGTTAEQVVEFLENAGWVLVK